MVVAVANREQDTNEQTTTEAEAKTPAESTDEEPRDVADNDGEANSGEDSDEDARDDSGVDVRRPRARRTDPVPTALTALAIITSIPVVVFLIPNTASILAPTIGNDLGPGVGAAAAAVRGYGLALPALMITTPLAVSLALRTRGWPVLFAGLLVLAASYVFAGNVDSVVALAALRAVQGVAGGAVLAGTLVSARARPDREWQLLAGLWSATLVASMLAVTPLLYRLVGGGDWRAALSPYPWLVGAALVTVAGLVLRGGERPTPVRARRSERLMLFSAVPALIIGGLAIGSTYGWGGGILLVLAVASLVLLFGITSLGGALGGRTGAEHVVVAVTIGAVVLPVSGQAVNLLLPGFTGPGLNTAWLPLAVGVVVAFGGGLAGFFSDLPTGALGTAGGLAIAAVGSLAVLVYTWRPGAGPIFGCMVLLGFGASLALGGTLRHVRTVTAGIALGGCLSAVLVGQLFAGTIKIRAVEGGGSSLADGVQTWAIVATLVLLIAAADVLAGKGLPGGASLHRLAAGRRTREESDAGTD